MVRRGRQISWRRCAFGARPRPSAAPAPRPSGVNWPSLSLSTGSSWRMPVTVSVSESPSGSVTPSTFDRDELVVRRPQRRQAGRCRAAHRRLVQHGHSQGVLVGRTVLILNCQRQGIRAFHAEASRRSKRRTIFCRAGKVSRAIAVQVPAPGEGRIDAQPPGRSTRRRAPPPPRAAPSDRGRRRPWAPRSPRSPWCRRWRSTRRDRWPAPRSRECWDRRGCPPGRWRSALASRRRRRGPGPRHRSVSAPSGSLPVACDLHRAALVDRVGPPG